MTDIDHDRCSELLLDRVRETLDAPDRAAVDRHLDGCEACRKELRAIEALSSGAVPALDERARSDIRRNVWSEVRPRDATVVPLRRGGPRVAKALGAAALIAVLLAGISYIGGTGGDGLGGGDQSTAGGAGAAQEGAPRKGSDDKERARKGPAPTALQEGAADEARPRPTFALIEGPVTDRELNEVGTGDLFQHFSASYTDAGATRARGDLTDALAQQAPADLAPQVRSCAQRVYGETRGRALPAFGTTGSLEGRRVLVLGFAYSRASGGPLDRFMFWAWRRGTCQRVLHYDEGAIPRP